MIDKNIELEKFINETLDLSGEIALNVLGGFCVIADVVPYHADTLEEAEEAL